MPEIIQQLIKKGVLSLQQGENLEKDFKKSDQKEENFLLESGVVAEEEIFKIKSEKLKLSIKEVVAEDIPLDVLGLIPEDAAKHYKMAAVGKTGDVVDVGMVNPEDISAQEALSFLGRRSAFKYQVFLITPSTFDATLKRYRTFKAEVTQALGELEQEIKQGKAKPKGAGAEALERLVEEAPITRVVAVLLQYGVEGKASDIHIEPTRKEVRVRFRQDGVLHTRLILPLKILSAIVARVKILSNLRIDESRVPQDGRFSTKLEERNIDFRVSTFPTSMGEKVAIRILDPNAGLKGLPDLGLTGRNLKLVQEVIKQPFGSILSTGPTGSGKTTTLYALLQILNKESVNVITLEDPIEYFVEGVNQSQVRPEIGYDFASGLRAILRQDPNVIMVGEIRDSETASLATHAALTGHLVLSTLHTNNAVGVIPRLIDLGVASYLIPPTLKLAMAQRLVRYLCDACKKKVKVSETQFKIFETEFKDLPDGAIKELPAEPWFMWQAVGCRKCHQSGYIGRVALFELLEVSDEIANLILKNPSESEIAKIAKRQGMVTMHQDGMMKVLTGITSLEEVIRVTEEE